MSHEPQREQEPAPIAGLNELRRDQVPQRDLWPGIAARLPPRHRRLPGWIGYAAAASVAAVVGLGVWQSPTPETETGASVAATPQADAEATRGTMMAWAPPENGALVKANLKIVASAESQLRLALEQDPDSRLLQRQMARMQDQRQALRRLMNPSTEAGI